MGKHITFCGLTLILFLVVFMNYSTVFGQTEIGLEDIEFEGFFFWEQNPQTNRWIPRVLVHLNNTSEMELHMDHIEVNFTNIKYRDNSTESGFSLESPVSILIPLGHSQLTIIMSEYGFEKKPTYLEFELRMHILEIQDYLILTNTDIVSLSQMKGIMNSIEYEVSLLRNENKALVRYSMEFRNPHDYSITVEISISFQEKHTLDPSHQPRFSKMESGFPLVEQTSGGTWIYGAPYFTEIEAHSSYNVYLEYKIMNVTEEQNSRSLLKNLELTQPPNVQYATLKVCIPIDAGSLNLWTLSTFDSSTPHHESLKEITHLGNCYSIIWKNSILKEDSYVIRAEEITYSYTFDRDKLGLGLPWLLPFVIGIFVDRIIIYLLSRRKKSRKTRPRTLTKNKKR